MLPKSMQIINIKRIKSICVVFVG